jgi:hypothetical protein
VNLVGANLEGTLLLGCRMSGARRTWTKGIDEER